jgi:hypothetical protein
MRLVAMALPIWPNPINPIFTGNSPFINDFAKAQSIIPKRVRRLSGKIMPKNTGID